MAKPVNEMAAGELVHHMLVLFSRHCVSRDKSGWPDEFDSPHAQPREYGEACERLNELLPAAPGKETA